MKRYLKILCGCVLTASICVPVFAENIPVLFNQVRIHCIDDGNVTSWGENIDGRSDMPSSILYNGTTYVPLRWISENMEKTVVWNGDSKTVGITEKDISYTNDKLTTKADLNGNEWTYSIVNGKYLSILDKERNYERRYMLKGNNAYKIDDDAIWLVDYRGYLYKILFLNDKSSQDGEMLFDTNCYSKVSQVRFNKGYLYAAGMEDGSDVQGHLTAVNINTLETEDYRLEKGHILKSFSIKSLDEDITVIDLIEEYSGCSIEKEVYFSKLSGKFTGEKIIESAYEQRRIIYEDGLTLKDFGFIKRNMSQSKIHDYLGKPMIFFDEQGFTIDYYILNDGSEIQFKYYSNGLAEALLETPDCVRVWLEFRSDGTLNIEN